MLRVGNETVSRAPATGLESSAALVRSRDPTRVHGRGGWRAGIRDPIALVVEMPYGKLRAGNWLT